MLAKIVSKMRELGSDITRFEIAKITYLGHIEEVLVVEFQEPPNNETLISTGEKK